MLSAVSCQAFSDLVWGVNLPNTGVLLYLQNSVGLNYYLEFTVIGLASVPDRCLRNIGVLIFLFGD